MKEGIWWSDIFRLSWSDKLGGTWVGWSGLWVRGEHVNARLRSGIAK